MLLQCCHSELPNLSWLRCYEREGLEVERDARWVQQRVVNHAVLDGGFDFFALLFGQVPRHLDFDAEIVYVRGVLGLLRRDVI